MGMIVSYLRVSTKEQDTRRQERAIEEYCKDNNIKLDKTFIDKESGKSFEREGYKSLKEYLRKGDTLIIKELDRLGRNMELIKEEWQYFSKNGINIVIIDSPILNTKDKSDLEKTLISNIVFELLAYMGEKERIKIKQRQAEGIAEVKRTGRTKTGKPMGRPTIQKPKDWSWVYKSWKDGDITATKAMELLELKRDTFYKFVKQEEGK